MISTPETIERAKEVFKLRKVLSVKRDFQRFTAEVQGSEDRGLIP
jgi:hypothetical protein